MDHGKRDADVLSLGSKVVTGWLPQSRRDCCEEEEEQNSVPFRTETSDLLTDWACLGSGKCKQVTLNDRLPGNSGASSKPVCENYTWVLHFHALIFILRKVGLRVLLVILKWNK